jgi:hypothetical protein
MSPEGRRLAQRAVGVPGELSFHSHEEAVDWLMTKIVEGIRQRKQSRDRRLEDLVACRSQKLGARYLVIGG